MSSINIVPRVLTCALFLIALCLHAQAQTSSLSEAWKNSNQNNSQPQATTETSSPTPKTEAIIEKEKSNPSSQTATTVSSAWSFKPPVEPTVKPANPALELGNKVTAVELKKLDKVAALPDDEIVGVEPPRAFQATAYSLPGRTRSGAHVRRGVIAADPRVLPLGSVVHLKAGNYSGVYTVHDTGGAIKGKIIDVWMPSSREARSFGRRSIRLTVLKYGRGGKPAKR